MIDTGWVSGGVAMLTALGALAASSLHVVWANQRLAVFRFGVLTAVKGPGLVFVLPGVGRGVRVSLAEATAATERTSAWGVAVTLVEISRMQLSLDPQLIRWAERFSGGSGAGRTT